MKVSAIVQQPRGFVGNLVEFWCRLRLLPEVLVRSKAELLFAVPILIAACLALYQFAMRRENGSSSNVIDYRGERIKLSKSYYDFDTYKNDPDNIDPSETRRVQKLVMEAPTGHWFPDRLSAFQATGDIQFPGYGSASGEGQESDGSELLSIDVEIPRAEKNRYFLFRLRGGGYELLDDFVEREIVHPYQVRHEGGYYIFVPKSKPEAFRRPDSHKPTDHR